MRYYIAQYHRGLYALCKGIQTSSNILYRKRDKQLLFGYHDMCWGTRNDAANGLVLVLHMGGMRKCVQIPFTEE